MSPSKAACRNKSSPYLIPQWILEVEPFYTGRALTDPKPPAYYCDTSTHPYPCEDNLDVEQLIPILPKDVVRDTVKAQYADCEVTRHCVLTVTWELERQERWKSFYSRSLKFFEEQNRVSQKGLEFWRKWCKDQGLDVHPQEQETTQRLLEMESTMLEHLQRRFRNSENTAVSIGVFDPKDLLQPWAAPSGNLSDTDRSSNSDPKISTTDKLPSPASPLGNLSDSGSDDSNLVVPSSDRSEVPYSSELEPPSKSMISTLTLAMRLMVGRQGHKDILKPGRGSQLNPCLLPNATQLGIQSEFTQNPIPMYTKHIQNYAGALHGTELCARAESINPTQPADPWCGPELHGYAVSMPTQSMVPANYGVQPRFQPPQSLTHPTPYPLEAIRNVPAFTALHSVEVEHGQFMQGASDVEITGPPHERALQGTNLPPAELPTAEVVTQVGTTLPARSAINATVRKQILADAKTHFRCEILTSSPFPSQGVSNDLARQSVDAAIHTHLGDSRYWIIDDIRGEKALSKIVSSGNVLRSSFKAAARLLVPVAYSLTPGISSIPLQSANILVHYSQQATNLLDNYNFMYEQIQDGAREFGHQALIELLLTMLWAQPGERFTIQLNNNTFTRLLALSGAAIVSTLREYKSGRYVAVEFSERNIGADFEAIQGFVETVHQEIPSRFSLLHLQL
ncbi:hypothetical protein BKA82DRAFT_10421 [Pisolithus tinctorius]|uniref:DUF6532 domain-containing protein n=1 Tax=Pisolithus tinctorius Marx 270 TaxID=870435 RepID=A0A0C3NVC5_PISTI|nr:hypothetical protein BKA82DRAFT_10421 [Pisolithus tinctorius]KIN99345.1 hypothetical protein M404DRAFT_10421 [Pisolithus tinctorius Marx 270]